MFKWLSSLKKGKNGQGLVEFGLILALVSAIAIGSIDVVDKSDDIYENVTGPSKETEEDVVSGPDKGPILEKNNTFT